MRRAVGRLALAGVACALTVAPASVSAGASTLAAPICVPDGVNASAQLPGTPLLVTPAPGSRDAMPQTQLSFLGAPTGQLVGLTVSGSVTGSHAGLLAPYSQGDGASFLPASPFESGETVSVSGDWSDLGVLHPFAYTFTVGDPDPIARLAEPGVPSGPSGSVLHFVSAPRIDPAALNVTLNSAAAQPGGDIFLSTYPGPGATGPTIFNPHGKLVWFKPLPSGTFATNLRVQRYDGRAVLTWWQGTISKHGFGFGEGEIYSTSYREVATVHAGDGLTEDLHDLELEPDGVALITAVKPLYCDLSALGAPADGAVYDSTLQAIDIRTGLVLWEWDSLDHVPLSDTYMPLGLDDAAWPYDWFHLNSIAVEPNGSIVISARSTWALYDLDPATGAVVWELGGRDPSFTMGPGTLTAWQHDAQPLSPDTISVFNNGGGPSPLRHSHGLVLRIDTQTNTVKLVARLSSSKPIFALTQGDVQRLPNGDWWIGWGSAGQNSEVSPSGKQLFLARTSDGSISYRTFRFPWSAQPLTLPQVAVRRGRHGDLRVYASWNGATDVARWQLEAGRSPGSLRALGSVASTGFETVMSVAARAQLRHAGAFLAVVALDRHGRTLARSLPIAQPS